jgi:hypothetical protein
MGCQQAHRGRRKVLPHRYGGRTRAPFDGRRPLVQAGRNRPTAIIPARRGQPFTIRPEDQAAGEFGVAHEGEKPFS